MSSYWAAWIVFVAICFGAAAIGSVSTASSVKIWYPGLRKPPGTPPSWAFGPVWSTLYLLMATAAWLVWRQSSGKGTWVALGFFFLQLALNAIWSYIFFGLRRPGVALVEILCLLVAIALATLRFAVFSRPAFWLMTPYVTWVVYATYLNFGIWRLNRGVA